MRCVWYIHPPPQTSKPCPPNSPSNDQSLTRPIIGSSHVLICKGQSLPPTTYAGLDSLSCGQPAHMVCLTLHHLPSYLHSSLTGLLSTPQDTAHPPAWPHLHRSLSLQYSPVFPPTFFYLTLNFQSYLKHQLLRGLLFSPKTGALYTPCYTLLYISSTGLITNVALRILAHHIINICQSH